MNEILTTEDLRPFLGDDADTAKVAAMIDDVLAQATMAAPCLDRDDLPEHVRLAARAILRGAVLRWHERGLSGAVTQASEQVSAIGFQHARTTTTETRGTGRLLWPREIADLEALCRSLDDENDGGYGRRAFGVDLAVLPPRPRTHPFLTDTD